MAMTIVKPSTVTITVIITSTSTLTVADTTNETVNIYLIIKIYWARHINSFLL